MEKIIHICDRCHTEFSEQEFLQKFVNVCQFYKINIYKMTEKNLPFLRSRLELCPKCCIEFEQWLNKENNIDINFMRK